MTIFHFELSYISRVFSYSRYRILKPILLYILFALISKDVNPFSFDIVMKFPFLFYLLLFTISILIRTRFFLREMTYDEVKREFKLVVMNFNIESIYIAKIDNIKMEVFLYDIITRSVNHFLKVTLGNQNVIKQFDYLPWTHEFMLEAIRKVDVIKSNQPNVKKEQ